MLSKSLIAVLALLVSSPLLAGASGDLGVVVERAAGRVMVVETSAHSLRGRISGLGDLSHASVVFSRDMGFAYVFGRDGGLSKIDLLKLRLVKRIMQAGNSIGGAISQDGRLIAVSNYEPGGVRVFDAGSLAPVAEIPAFYGDGKQRSRVVGLVDAPGRRFVFSLFDAGEIWIADMSTGRSAPQLEKMRRIGQQPYDGLITPDGRYYLAGLFGEDGLALIDLWQSTLHVQRILDEYGRGEERLPVYKMPHLEGWASAGDYLFLPAVGRHEILVVGKRDWQLKKRIPVHGQPVFAIARPDGRQVWVNFALPDNDTVQIIDVRDLLVANELRPGKAVLHMEFTPRGEDVWVSVRDDNVVRVYDTASLTEVAALDANRPSGIFFAARAHRIGL